MKTFTKSFVFAVAAGAICQVAEAAVATDTATFSIDTRRIVKTQAELSAMMNAVYGAGETVTMTSPAGAESTLVSAAAEDGTVEVKTHIDAGGRWTFANSVQGTATISVRNSVFGTPGGDGTAASPAHLVDGEALVDFEAAGTAGDGYVFDVSGVDGLLAELVLPAGYSIEPAGEGVWRMIESTDGAQYIASAPYSLDTEKTGPDRFAVVRSVLAVSYSADAIGTSAGATMTLRSPSGVETSYPASSAESDGETFVLRESGDWTLTLVRGNSSWTAVISAVPGGFVLIVR